MQYEYFEKFAKKHDFSEGGGGGLLRILPYLCVHSSLEWLFIADPQSAF